jgi:hypothetical protein
MEYRGSCHCGKVAYTVEGEINEAYACNCSLCSRRGSLLWFAPREKFRLLSGEGDLTTYTFNKHVIQHRFCPNCGIHVFGEAIDPKGNAVAAVNLRCVENIDLAAIPVKNFDGKAK